MNKSLFFLATLAVACTSNKGDTADSAADTDTNTDAVYGCSVADWDICYDHYTTDGWDQASATESCDFLASQYGVATSFLANPGCPTTSAVGECDLPAGGDFTYGVTALYGSSFDSGAAETACGSAGGTYFGF